MTSQNPNNFFAEFCTSCENKDNCGTVMLMYTNGFVHIYKYNIHNAFKFKVGICTKSIK